MVYVNNSKTGDSEEIVYPTATMREVGNEILANVRTSREQHNTQWHVVQQYISKCAPTYKTFGIAPSFGFTFEDGVQNHMQDVLDPHNKRLNNSYDWLEKFANALIDAANEMEKADQQVKAKFDA